MACGFNSVTALLCLVSFWIFTFSFTSAAHQSAPAPAADCNNLVLNLADCLSFITNGSTEKKPAGTCCSGLKMVLKTDADCLCEGFKNSAQLGVALNVTKALSLPSACHVSAPSVTNCGLSIGSGAAPALSPTAVSPSATAGTPSTAAGTNVVAPAPAPGSSGSASLCRSFGPLALTIGAAFSSLF
ncbi:non-specific lipid transfer protein GPI-anchored 31-like [Nicotiana tabacum]|uniref:Non-specific lipid transfer protein GPI-anchored 31-like n=2 Tax=Nicotiana TaxID=4085 RepID=A0A1S4B2X1_TOBAC|nr:PREDICTED: non-specific lipid-transfer protein-like protein At2g13820 [Nicotiana sylvestris]XP_016483176.1 PREDICTED: non-specific lipid-transfer protein-like protein At2g13820 [Nicotiana tabacum]